MTFPPQPGIGQSPLPYPGEPGPAHPGAAQPAWGQPGPPVPLVPQSYHPLPPQGYAVPPHPVVPLPYKDGTAAWLFWFFLGSFGAHHFYLGRTRWGVAYAVGFVLSWLTTLLLIGFLGLLALFVLWIVDATQMSQRLQRYNTHAHAVNRSLGLA